MWQGMLRAGLALWFIGMVGLAVWHQQPPTQAQAAGAQTLHLPLIQYDRRAYDPALHDYIGLVRVRQGGDVDFYTVRGDSTDWTLLADDAEFDAAWSPNGAYFGYNKEEQGGFGLVSLATRQERLLTDGFARYVKWSSDSRRLALLSAQQILVYNVQTGQTELTVDVPTFQYPRLYWSPDGQYLAWAYEQGTNQDAHLWIWTAGAAMPRLVAVQSGDTAYSTILWSPNSRRLLFSFDRYPDIYMAEADGDSSVLVRNDGYSAVQWMPDSRHLLLNPPSDSDLYLADLTDAPPTLLVENATPRLSPNGDGFYYVPYPAQQPGYFYDMTTRQSIPVNVTCDIATVQWLRDGDELRCDDRALGNGTTWGRPFYTRVADFSSLPPVITHAISSHTLTPMVPPQLDIVATSHEPLVHVPRPGYPVPRYEGSYLYQIPLKQLRRINYPDSRRQPVIEWRYMP